MSAELIVIAVALHSKSVVRNVLTREKYETAYWSGEEAALVWQNLLDEECVSKVLRLPGHHVRQVEWLTHLE